MSPGALLALVWLHRPYVESAVKKTGAKEAAPKQAAPAETSSPLGRRGVYVLLAFVLLITLRATTQQGFTTLLPKYFADQGYSPDRYGAMLGMLGLAGATGTFVGGWLGDRFNRRMVIFVAMTLGALFSLLMLYTDGWHYAVVALVAGLLMNMPHSILIIMAQRLLPARKGMVGGAVLGLMFASGAATAGVASWIADSVGLPLVLAVIALAPLGAALCALLLPSTRGAERPLHTAKKGAVSAAD
jgi:predicted MFS family arabinose efflux permease